VATATVPQVVPFRKPTGPVTQTELALVLSLRDRIRELETQIAEAEAAIQAQLEAGLPVEPGLLKAFLRVSERRSVAWKAVVERELGEYYAKRVLAATKPERFVHLVVTA